MLPTIIRRRSIRKFKNIDIPRPMVEEILHAGILAPSSKNRQPWKFIVVTGHAKKEMVEVMARGLDREKNSPLLPESKQYLSGAENTLNVMESAPVIIFIINPQGLDIHSSINPEERVYEICNSQSVGAAIENMTLTATELGLGSLWICDTFFAYEELCSWLAIDGELYAALAVGYSDESPAARPRKCMEEAVVWRD